MHKYLRHCHFSSGRVWECKFEVDDDIDVFEMTLLERYNTRPREDELLRELEGLGDVVRMARFSGVSLSDPVRGGVCCCGGLCCAILGDEKRGSPTYEGE